MISANHSIPRDQGNPVVAVVRYEEPLHSVRRAVDLSRLLHHVPTSDKIFIKPNVVFWSRAVDFPKWGVITTSRVVEDMVISLKERGFDRIYLGEGMLVNPEDRQTPHHAFQSLGYRWLEKRYGLRCLNVYERPFISVDLGEHIVLNVNADALDSDLMINMPVLKTHAQTVVSLGVKNLKGLIDIPSRKACHSPEKRRNLHYMIAKLAKVFPRCATLLDGIYTQEQGPGFDGKARRSNILIASRDLLSADMVGSKVMGYDPAQVPHIRHALRAAGRSDNLSDLRIVGEKVSDLAVHHEYDFPYNDEETLPLALEKMGVSGLSYRKYDLTMCTYCSALNWLIVKAVAQAWRGVPWDEVEILTGKTMEPTPGKRKTILIGRCIYLANREHPEIREMIAVKGCPPRPGEIVKAFHRAGIHVDPAMFANPDEAPGQFMRKYEGRPDYDESFFRVA